MRRFSILKPAPEREIAATAQHRELGRAVFPMDDYLSKFRSIGRTHAGNVRSCNEDAFIERGEVGLWAVSDGMGGHKAGDVASGLVVAALNAVQPSDAGLVSDGVVRHALARVNSVMFEQGKTHDGMMGATVAVLLAGKESFFCLWAGDSRLYRFRHGQLTRLTRDHRYIQTLLDAGVLTEEAALVHPRRHVITRAVGVDAELKLDAVEGKIERGDILMLVTDGVTSVCSDDDLAALLKSEPDLEVAADAMVQRCLERGAPDNLTLVLVAKD